MISLAKFIDIPDLKELWKICFPTEKDNYLEYFFEHIFPMARCYIMKDKSKIISMAYTINDSLLSKPSFSYSYALATHPEYRGLNLIDQLLDAIDHDNRELNIDAQILVPSDEGLEQMYRKKGFSTFNKKVSFHATCFPDTNDINWFIFPISPKEYSNYRATYLQNTPTLHWDEKYYTHFLNLQRLENPANFYQIMCADLEGIFFAAIDKDMIRIKDMILKPVHHDLTQPNQTTHTLFSIMNAISTKLGKEKYFFELNRISADMKLFVPETNGLIRYSNPKVKPIETTTAPYFCLYLE